MVIIKKLLFLLKKRFTKSLYATLRIFWLNAALILTVRIIIKKGEILESIAYSLSLLFVWFLLEFIFLPKRRKRKGLFSQQCDLEAQASVGLYDDVDICGRKVNWGLRLEQKQKSQIYNIDSKFSSKIY